MAGSPASPSRSKTISPPRKRAMKELTNRGIE
jgi:hypothetical protein